MKSNGGAEGLGAEFRDVALVITDAIVEHEVWLRAWQRTVTCGLKPDETVTAARAHTACRFGRWLDDNRESTVLQDESLRHLARTHRHLHDVARLVAGRAADGGAVAPDDYDAVMHAAAEFGEAAERVRDEHGETGEPGFATFGSRGELESRLTMLNELERERERALRTGMAATVLVVRPSGLDEIEAAHGGAGIDRLVASLAMRLFATLRPYDGVYRFGRTEFLICLPATTPGQATRVAARLLSAIGEQPVALSDDVESSVTARIGIAGIGDRRSVQETVDNAARAAAQAVSDAGDAIVVWPAGPGAS